MSLNFYCEEEKNSNKTLDSINKYKNLFINYDEKIPSLSEALSQMYKSSNLKDKKINELTEDIITKCKARIDPEFDIIKMKYFNLTKEDAYIICSYTCESLDEAFSPYRILNKNLLSDNKKNTVNNISKYLYILLKSLRKLPRYYPKKSALYRYITIYQDNFDSKFPYRRGIFKFWGFTSTLEEPKTVDSLSKEQKGKKNKVIFSLCGDIWGYEIELFNFFHEKEILLEPELKLYINDISPSHNGVTNIHCKIFDKNLILNDNNFGQIQSLKIQIQKNM